MLELDQCALPMLFMERAQRFLQSKIQNLNSKTYIKKTEQTVTDYRSDNRYTCNLLR